jgi:hypothetical protein
LIFQAMEGSILNAYLHTHTEPQEGFFLHAETHPDIERWLAAEPRLTALAILGRLAEHSPEKFGPPQHTIVQRLLRSLRRNAAEVIIPRMAGGTAPAAIGDPGTACNDATSDRPTVGTKSVKRK